ncbi:hypothetical protein JCM8097_006831 [Rhodosporidiobolus ruineniae]
MHPLPPLLLLPPEALDLVLHHTLPSHANLRTQRRVLSVLLCVHPVLTALVRRRLYRKVTLVVGDTKGRDGRLMDLLDGGADGSEEEKSKAAGHHVKFLKIRVPDADPSSMPFDRDSDPAAALLPRAVLSFPDTVDVVTRFVEAVTAPVHVELDCQVGMRFEGEPEEAGDDVFGGTDKLKRLEQAWTSWRTINCLVFSVEDVQQRLQVLASPSSSSPFLTALATWDNLTILDLWRAKLGLPPSMPKPRFRLETLHLIQCTFGRLSDLLWLTGGPDEPRARKLKRLVLNEVEFLSHPAGGAPSSSAEPHPLVSFFRPSTAPANEAPFVSTLSDLTLILRDPLPSAGLDTLLSPYTSLTKLEIGGPGVSLPLLSSVFTPFTSSSHSAAPTPASSLKDLALTYLTHPSLPLSSLLSLLSPPSPSSTPLTALQTLRFYSGFPLPRSLPWRVRHATPEPRWEPLTTYDADWEAERKAWAEVEDAVRGVNRAKRRAGLGGGGERVRLWKNRLEVTYADYSAAELAAAAAAGLGGEDDEEEEEEEEEEDAPVVDPNGLWLPPDDVDEEEDTAAWLARRRAEGEADEEEEEDY